MEQGLGHRLEGNAPDGSMAIFCPACPQPGVNLPDDWRTRYQPYVIPPDLVLVLTTYCPEGMNSSGHLSWMGTSLRNT